LFSEFHKVFSKYIGTNLEKHVMEKKGREENERKKGLPSAPRPVLGKAVVCQVPAIWHLANLGFADCPRSGTRQT
jgi:hypothetical protein